MIYICSPYTHPFPVVRTHRFLQVQQYCAERLKAGESVFSPIVHNHHMVEDCDMPISADIYLPWLEDMISKATELRVLQMLEWDKSEGIQREIELARKYGVPVVYVEAP